MCVCVCAHTQASDLGWVPPSQYQNQIVFPVSASSTILGCRYGYMSIRADVSYCILWTLSHTHTNYTQYPGALQKISHSELSVLLGTMVLCNNEPNTNYTAVCVKLFFATLPFLVKPEGMLNECQHVLANCGDAFACERQKVWLSLSVSVQISPKRKIMRFIFEWYLLNKCKVSNQAALFGIKQVDHTWNKWGSTSWQGYWLRAWGSNSAAKQDNSSSTNHLRK